MGEITYLKNSAGNLNDVYMFDDMKKDFEESTRKLWWDTDDHFPFFETKLSKDEQRIKESETNKFIKTISSRLQELPEDNDQRIAQMDDLKKRSLEFCHKIMGLREGHTDILFREGFVKATQGFLKEARRFDPEIKIEDIFQAIRNVWIMNSIQVFLGREIEYTPSVFAYSMLYPYTDNYLDNKDISLDSKLQISKRFGMRLAGESINPQNSYELALFALVQMIEEQYSRRSFPEVFKSLCAIHSAQERSLMQQSKWASPYDKDILGISIEKGGMSVLADAYLVNGKLDRDEAEFMFEFGVILQLSDDLQDVAEDKARGHATIFSQTAGKWPLDTITNRLFNFISRLMNSKTSFSSPEMMEMKGLIQYNCHLLILQAIAKSQKFFSREYVRKIQSYTPYRFSYMRGLYKRLLKRYKYLNKKSKVKSLEDKFLSMSNL